MDLPEVVRGELNDEPVAARVGLGGADVLLVTPTRTIVYRGEGLLSDESVETYPHGTERIELDEGRRKAKVHLDYGLDGERTLALPTKRAHEALHPMLAGVLNAAGVTDPGETVKETFLLSELTVVVTSKRLVKHVGAAVWDDDYEEYRYDDVTDLVFEEGNVATSVVVHVGASRERFKVPNDRARALRESLVDALLAFHEFDTLEAFRTARADAGGDEAGDAGAEAGATDQSNVDFGAGPDPLDASPELSDDAGRQVESAPSATTEREASGATQSTDEAALGGAGRTATREERRQPAESEQRESGRADANAETDAEKSFAGSGFEAAGPVDERELAAEVAALRETIERQNRLIEAHGERIDEQRRLFEQLVEELRQGR
jgi:hypothetical protein